MELIGQDYSKATKLYCYYVTKLRTIIREIKKSHMGVKLILAFNLNFQL